jgi:hypothetical protein
VFFDVFNEFVNKGTARHKFAKSQPSNALPTDLAYPLASTFGPVAMETPGFEEVADASMSSPQVDDLLGPVDTALRSDEGSKSISLSLIHDLLQYLCKELVDPLPATVSDTTFDTTFGVSPHIPGYIYVDVGRTIDRALRI